MYPNRGQPRPAPTASRSGTAAGAPPDRETENLVREMGPFPRQAHVPGRLVATMLAAWELTRAETGSPVDLRRPLIRDDRAACDPAPS